MSTKTFSPFGTPENIGRLSDEKINKQIINYQHTIFFYSFIFILKHMTCSHWGMQGLILKKITNAQVLIGKWTELI